MAECIKRRLLHIAEQTYYNPLAATGRFAEIGWTGDAAMIRREPNVAVVGAIDKGVVVAFRGTRAPLNPHDDDAWATFLDWLNDADYVCGHGSSYPGNVHSGFAGSVDALWDDKDGAPGIRTTVEKLWAAGAPRALFLTGHSKGGPLANLAAWRAVTAWPDVKPRVVTFAAARAGDEEFARAYAQAGIRCTRYEVTADVVPRLPIGHDTPAFLRTLVAQLPGVSAPSLDYVGVGDLVSGGGSALRNLLGRVRGLLSGHGWDLRPEIVAAHLIAPDSGYDKLVCPRGEPGCAHS